MLVQSHLNNRPSNRWLHPWHTCKVRKLRIRGLGSFRQRAQQNPSLTCFFTPPLLLHHLLFCSVLLNTCQEQSWSNQHLAMVAWRVLNAIFWINLYLVGITVHFVNSYRLIYPLKTRVISPFKRRVCHTPTLLPPKKKKIAQLLVRLTVKSGLSGVRISLGDILFYTYHKWFTHFLSPNRSCP